MSEHYSGNDPGTGCGLMLIGLGIMLVVALVGLVWLFWGVIG